MICATNVYEERKKSVIRLRVENQVREATNGCKHLLFPKCIYEILTQWHPKLQLLLYTGFMSCHHCHMGTGLKNWPATLGLFAQKLDPNKKILKLSK